MDLQDLRQQLLLCLLETHDLQAAALVLFRGRLQLLLVFELLKGVVEVVVQSAFLYTATRKHLPQELGEREVVLLLPLGVSLGVEFLPAQLGEAGRKQLVVLKNLIFILWLEVDLR